MVSTGIRVGHLPVRLTALVAQGNKNSKGQPSSCQSWCQIRYHPTSLLIYRKLDIRRIASIKNLPLALIMILLVC